jgi:hypothetical protein
MSNQKTEITYRAIMDKLFTETKNIFTDEETFNEFKIVRNK